MLILRRVAEDIVVDDVLVAKVVVEDDGRLGLLVFLSDESSAHEQTVVFLPKAHAIRLAEMIGRMDGTGRRLVLDFTAVDIVTAGVLGAMIGLHRRCLAKMGRLTVRNLSEMCKEVVKICRLHELFEVD